jgi:hypothetical protein
MLLALHPVGHFVVIPALQIRLATDEPQIFKQVKSKVLDDF